MDTEESKDVAVLDQDPIELTRDAKLVYNKEQLIAYLEECYVAPDELDQMAELIMAREKPVHLLGFYEDDEGNRRCRNTGCVFLLQIRTRL